MKALTFLWNYLKDWRNWLTHTLTGIGILLIAFYLPVKPIYRIGILIVVITFNILRMRHKKKMQANNNLDQ
jgi:hypothetical protein